VIFRGGAELPSEIAEPAPEVAADLPGHDVEEPESAFSWAPPALEESQAPSDDPFAGFEFQSSEEGTGTEVSVGNTDDLSAEKTSLDTPFAGFSFSDEPGAEPANDEPPEEDIFADDVVDHESIVPDEDDPFSAAAVQSEVSPEDIPDSVQGAAIDTPFAGFSFEDDPETEPAHEEQPEENIFADDEIDLESVVPDEDDPFGTGVQGEFSPEDISGTAQNSALDTPFAGFSFEDGPAEPAAHDEHSEENIFADDELDLESVVPDEEDPFGTTGVQGEFVAEDFTAGDDVDPLLQPDGPDDTQAGEPVFGIIQEPAAAEKPEKKVEADLFDFDKEFGEIFALEDDQDGAASVKN
jgi:hypothetical protein